jgi:hypothetical protein
MTRTAMLPVAVSSVSGRSAIGKLPVESLIMPSRAVAPDVPMCDKVLIAAMPAAAVLAESQSVA